MDSYAYSAPRSFMMRRTSCPSSSLTGACCSAARAARIPGGLAGGAHRVLGADGSLREKFRAKTSARYQKVPNVLYHKRTAWNFKEGVFVGIRRFLLCEIQRFAVNVYRNNWTGKMHRGIFCGTKDRERLQHIPYRCCGFPAHRPWARFLQYRRFQSLSCIFDKSGADEKQPVFPQAVRASDVRRRFRLHLQKIRDY